MGHTWTNPTWIKAKPHASAEKQVGDSDTLSRTDVIGRPSKGIAYALKKILNLIADGLTLDMTSVTDPTTTGLPGFTAGGGLRVVVTLTNKTGSAVAVGDVLAVDTGTNSAVVAGDTSASLQTYVVALEATANDAAGPFVLAGIVTAKAQGTIARGQYVKKSATAAAVDDAGTATAATATPPPGTLGLALQAAAGGTVLILKYGATQAASSLPAPGFDALGASLPSTNFPQLVKNVGTNQLDYTLDFDKDTGESCYWRYQVPTGISFSTCTAKVSSRQAAATSGTVGWVITTLSVADGDAWDQAGTADTVTADAVEGTAGQVHVQSKALTVTGWAAGETLLIKLARDVANDTVAEDAKFMDLTLVFA